MENKSVEITISSKIEERSIEYFAILQLAKLIDKECKVIQYLLDHPKYSHFNYPRS